MKTGRVVFVAGLLVVAGATAAGLAVVRAHHARLESELRERVARVEVDRAAGVAGVARPEVRSPARADDARAAAWRQEADRLAGEIDALRRQLAEREAAATAPAPVRLPSATLAARQRPANPWPCAGRAEPLAAFQTVQWAIHEGDLDTLERSLAFDEPATAAAWAFFSQLDAESRAEYRVPERLVAAAVAAKSLSAINQAEVVQSATNPDGSTVARLRISGPSATPREITLQFRPGADGWRLEVPASVVTSYRHLLLGPLVDPRTYQVVR